MKIRFDFQLHVHIHREVKSSCTQTVFESPSQVHHSTPQESGIGLSVSPHPVEHRQEPVSPPLATTGFSAYADEQISKLHQQGRFSTYRNYQTAIHSFMQFRKGKDIPLCNLSASLMADYERWLKSKDVAMGTISCYMRSLRAIYNKAVEEKLVDDREPFKKCFTGYPHTDKRSVTVADIRRLKDLPIKGKGCIRLVRDIFLFCIFACGMPFVDVAFLRKSQLSRDGYLTYYRHKTHQRIRVRLLPYAQEIIDRYANTDSEYVFPFLTKKDPEEAYKQYKKKLCYYNKLLKRLGEEAGISYPLTSYVSRHTWASLAYEQNTDVAVISKGLGHTSSHTTFIYIKGIDDSRLDEANSRIARQIMEPEKEEKVLDSVQEKYNEN